MKSRFALWLTNAGFTIWIMGNLLPVFYLSAAVFLWLRTGIWPDWSLVALGADLPRASWVGLERLLQWVWADIGAVWLVAGCCVIVGKTIETQARNLADKWGAREP